MSMNNSKLRGISKGFAANKLLRKRINEAIYATSVVVNKIELSYNKETKEYEITKDVKGLAVWNPVFERFGLNKDYKEMKLVKIKKLKGQFEGYIEEKYELEGEGRYSTIKLELERFNTSVNSEIIELQQHFDYYED